MQKKVKKTVETGFLRRLYNATLYSIDGIRFAAVNETAFKQEIILYFILTPLIIFLQIPLWFKALLFASNSLVLIVELVNSAIESVVDLVTEDFDIRAKRAKDLGSAAVFVSLIMTFTLWVVAIYFSFSGAELGVDALFTPNSIIGQMQ